MGDRARWLVWDSWSARLFSCPSRLEAAALLDWIQNLPLATSARGVKHSWSKPLVQASSLQNLRRASSSDTKTLLQHARRQKDRCECMYVCMHVCMNVFMYACMYACIYLYVYMYVCIYVRMNVCTYVCMYVPMYVCMYVCMFLCMYKKCNHS